MKEILELNRLFRKENKRHPMHNSNKQFRWLIGVNIAFMMLALAIYGIVAGTIFLKDFPNLQPIAAGGQYLFYILLAELLSRSIMQGVTSIPMESYLILPIPKRNLHHLMQLRSFFHPINMMLTTLLFSFVITLVATNKIPLLDALFFSLGALMLLGINNMINFLLKQIESLYSYATMVFIALIVLSGAITFLQSTAVRTFSGEFALTLSQGWILLPLLFVLLLFYFLNIRIMNKTYLVQLEIKEKNKAQKKKRLSFLDHLGDIGMYMNLQLGVLLHKRPKQILMSQLLFMGIVVFQAYQMKTSPINLLFFWIVFGLGQAARLLTSTGFGNESTYFDLLLMHPRSTYQMIRAKYYSSIILILVSALLYSSLCFFGLVPFKLLIYAVAYAIGIQSIVELFMLPYVKGRLEIGVTTKQKMSTMAMLMMFAISMLAIVIGIFGSKHEEVYWGVTAFSAMMLLMSPLWLKLIYRLFLKHKEVLASSFRK